MYKSVIQAGELIQLDSCADHTITLVAVKYCELERGEKPVLTGELLMALELQLF